MTRSIYLANQIIVWFDSVLDMGERDVEDVLYDNQEVIRIPFKVDKGIKGGVEGLRERRDKNRSPQRIVHPLDCEVSLGTVGIIHCLLVLLATGAFGLPIYCTVDVLLSSC